MTKKLSRRSFVLASAAALVSSAACSAGLSATDADSTGTGEYRAPPLVPEEVAPEDRLERTQEEWQELLSPEQYRVVRLKGTERAFTGDYNETKDEGTYHCVACGNPLFSSETKFNSGTGWPSYYEPIEEGRVHEETDRGLGMVRTEVLCARCGAHLGHVFNDGPPPTGLRYCINSVSLNFAPAAN